MGRLGLCSHWDTGASEQLQCLFKVLCRWYTKVKQVQFQRTYTVGRFLVWLGCMCSVTALGGFYIFTISRHKVISEHINNVMYSWYTIQI